MQFDASFHHVLESLGVFPTLATSKSSHDAPHRAAVFSSPDREIRPIKLLQYPVEMLYMRVQFLIPVDLTESGSSGKAGELFVLERAVVGNGPKKRLSAAQISFINKAVAPVLADIRSGMKPD